MKYFDEAAVWNMCDWFMHTIPLMLEQLRDTGMSYPLGFKDKDEWKAVLTEMIEYAKKMGSKDPIVADYNKDKFFEMFSKYFYYLWD